MARRLLPPGWIILSPAGTVVPSVSTVQSTDLRPPQASRSQRHGSDPFPELLEISANARRAVDDTHSASVARADSVPATRTKAQPDAPDDAWPPVAAPAEQPERGQASAETAVPPATSEPVDADQVIEPAEPDSVVLQTGALVEVLIESDVPANAAAGGNSDPGAVPAGEIETAAVLPASTATAGDGTPNQAGIEFSLPEAGTGDSVPTLTLTPTPTMPNAATDLQSAQGATPSTATSQIAVPTSTMPTPMQEAEAESATARGLISGHSRTPASGAPSPQPATVNTATSANLADPTVEPADAMDQQSPQQQNGSPALQSKTPEVDFTRPTDLAASPTPTLDANSRAQAHSVAPVPSSDPVRALATTLNPTSLQKVHSDNSNPVPLTGVALAVEILSRLREGVQRFEIRLDPPELGRVDVRLDVDRSGNVTTKLTVDRPETLELMQREARGLERALQSAGLKTDAGGLEFSLRSHADYPTSQDRPGGSEPNSDLIAAEESELAEAVESYRTVVFARGGVDIRV